MCQTRWIVKYVENVYASWLPFISIWVESRTFLPVFDSIICLAVFMLLLLNTTPNYDRLLFSKNDAQMCIPPKNLGVN